MSEATGVVLMPMMFMELVHSMFLNISIKIRREYCYI